MTDRITYRCPHCKHQTLIVDSIGHFVCSWLECRNPCAFSDLIDAALESAAPASPAPPGAPWKSAALLAIEKLVGLEDERTIAKGHTQAQAEAVVEAVRTALASPAPPHSADALHEISVMAMTAQSDPHAKAAVYRKALIDICNFALKAQGDPEIW